MSGVGNKQEHNGSTKTASKTLFPLGEGEMDRLPSSETEEKRFRESRSFRRFFSSILSNSIWRGKLSTSLKKSICDLDQRSYVLVFPDPYEIKQWLLWFAPLLPTGGRCLQSQPSIMTTRAGEERLSREDALLSLLVKSPLEPNRLSSVP